ncbi:MAG: Ppx/GppA family phosphatase [Nitrospinae bacterium]|nr:Ppx/GppA family phosphatase [Nitrospinota bacterium]
MKRAASLDLGTNTIRLLVAERTEFGFTPLYSGQVITRLGEGLHETGRLGEAAMKRTLDGILRMIGEAGAFAPFRLVIAATSAARDAANTGEFSQMVKNATGAPLTVIPWDEEARLSLLGVSLALKDRGGRFLLFDVGGGSTEYIMSEGGKVTASSGTNLGVVRLAETYITKHPVSDYEYGKMLMEVDATVDRAFAGLGVAGPVTLVGTAGTVTSIAAIAMGLVDYDPGKINNFALTAEKVESLRVRICAMAIEERSKIPFLKNGREDLIVPGFAIVQSTMRRARADSIIVSDYGLREGLMAEILLNGAYG